MGLRESAGISLEEVSNDINIPVIALEQIEAGTFGSFEDTSKIPSNEIVAAIKSSKKDEIIDDPDRIASPYTRAYPKEKTLPYILTFIVVLLLVALAVFWSVTQITVGNNSTDVLSYYTE